MEKVNLRDILIGIVIGYLVTRIMCKKKHNETGTLVRGVDTIKSNIREFVKSTGIGDDDSDDIANDLTNGRVHQAYSNYMGIKSKRYVLN